MYADGLLMMFLSAIFTTLLGLYMDNVIQQSYGTAKSALFFLDRTFWGYKDLKNVHHSPNDPLADDAKHTT